MSSGLGMCDRLNSLSLVCSTYILCTVIRGSLIYRIKLPRMYPNFASFNAPYNPVRRIYEKRGASIQFLIVR